MARVVCVHGVGSQQSGEQQLLRSWRPALRDGLNRAGAAGTLADDDIAMAFYGDLFLPLSGDLSAGDVRPGYEAELLMAWWLHAGAVEEQVAAPDTRDVVLTETPVVVQKALLALAWSRFFAGLAEHLLVADLKQVRRYLSDDGDDGLRAAARGRVAAAIGPDTRAVVAHSLGSVVAYEALCALPGHGVRALVTLGSPLGIPNLIFDQLDPKPVRGKGRWPGGDALAWTNLADDQDVVALVKNLRSRFGDRVANHIVENGSKAHDASHYLGKVECGAAIAASGQ
jgi:pimeloyl-ACP methyl ester carboxylesterase